METKGRTVRLFLVDGVSTGILNAEIINWTGHVLAAPRSRMGDVLNRDESRRTGVYFLIGEDPDEPGKAKVYVGEADEISVRIKTHANDPSKDFWTRFCFVTSKDGNITKAHARYLESSLIETIRESGRANIANGNDPGKKNLPESDVADMEYFLNGIELLLPTIGFDFLMPSAKTILEPSNTTKFPQAPREILRLFIDYPKKSYFAKAVELDGEITVLSGFTATLEEFATNAYAALRQRLIEDGSLTLTADKRLLRFTKDVSFASPSAAAAVVNNRNTNGRTEWRLENGLTLKQWQDSQVADA